jgi:hypothetical protein
MEYTNHNGSFSLLSFQARQERVSAAALRRFHPPQSRKPDSRGKLRKKWRRKKAKAEEIGL